MKIEYGSNFGVEIKAFFDRDTSTLSYIVWEPETRDAVIFDPVLDYDLFTSTYALDSARALLSFVERKNLRVHYIIETHAHADHMSSAQFLKKRLINSKVIISSRISEVQILFSSIFEFDEKFHTDGDQFDHLVSDGDILEAGVLRLKALSTPGHTPACNSYLIKGCIFVGDTLFMPDFGVSRCDFPGGSATDLYDSVKNKLYSLPDDTNVFTAHDYQPGGRELQFQTTIGESKAANIHINDQTAKNDFVVMRNKRDSTLKPPKLLFQSLQVNLNAGSLPKPSKNGSQYLKIPVKRREFSDGI